jgi:hypothetical protein
VKGFAGVEVAVVALTLRSARADLPTMLGPVPVGATFAWAREGFRKIKHPSLKDFSYRQEKSY